MSATIPVLNDILQERQRQHDKWGTQRHDFPVWLTVLGEEVGELAEAILTMRRIEAETPLVVGANADRLMREHRDSSQRRCLRHVRDEAIQVAAVAVAMIEHIDEWREVRKDLESRHIH